MVFEAAQLIERRLGADDEAVFLDLFSVRTLELVDLTPDDFTRVAELVRKYSDFPLGTVDASVVAVAESLGLSGLVTLDRRHFSAVQPKHRPSFELVP